MTSNEHGPIKQNEEHILMNILIYHAWKMDLWMRSYGMLNRAPEDVGVLDCKTDNRENARMHETNTYAKAMHMMT